jgi:hypothetical protein
MLFVEFEGASTGITVPYPPFRDKTRNNRGFVDLRGNPTAAGSVAEVAGSARLGELLSLLAEPGARFFSVGCDLGTHEDHEGPDRATPFFAGGYIHIIATEHGATAPSEYERLADSVADKVYEDEGESKRRDWMLRFVFQMVDFKVDGPNEGLIPSLAIWFHARAATALDALSERELLIQSMTVALFAGPRSDPDVHR